MFANFEKGANINTSNHRNKYLLFPREKCCRTIDVCSSENITTSKGFRLGFHYSGSREPSQDAPSDILGKSNIVNSTSTPAFCREDLTLLTNH